MYLPLFSITASTQKTSNLNHKDILTSLLLDGRLEDIDIGVGSIFGSALHSVCNGFRSELNGYQVCWSEINKALQNIRNFLAESTRPATLESWQNIALRG